MVNPGFDGTGATEFDTANQVISNGTLNAGEEEFFDIVMNIGPLDLTDKNQNYWTSGLVRMDDVTYSNVHAYTTRGLDPDNGDPLGPANSNCDRGYAVLLDYVANLNITKTVINSQPATSGNPDNLDLTYLVTIESDASNGCKYLQAICIG